MSGGSAPRPLGAAPPAIEQRPEPGRFWLRYRPRAWPSAPAVWTDLTRGGLGPEGDPGPAPRWPPAGLSDLAYVPPGAAPSARAHPLALAQVRAGEPVPPAAWVVVDLLEPLLAGDLALLESLPPGVSAVWPLIPGVSDDPSLWHQGLARLARAGVHHVQPLALELAPSDRRRLADHAGAAAFGALFHGTAPSERSFARVARPLGIQVFAPRPIVGVAGRAASNRRLAGVLALTAELWLRCGRGEPDGQALFRAARWVDETEHDVAALVREGHVGLIPWLTERAAALLAELLEDGSARLTAELEEEYASGGPTR